MTKIFIVAATLVAFASPAFAGCNWTNCAVTDWNAPDEYKAGSGNENGDRGGRGDADAAGE